MTDKEQQEKKAPFIAIGVLKGKTFYTTAIGPDDWALCCAGDPRGGGALRDWMRHAKPGDIYRLATAIVVRQRVSP